jgi:hypothetical protein
MNKKEFITKEIEKNKRAFGRWGSKCKRDSASRFALIHESAPRNEEEALQHGNALANTGNYPIGTSECFNVGIAGGCGPDCFVYLKGECDEPSEMLERLEGDEELKRHVALYGVPGELGGRIERREP